MAAVGRAVGGGYIYAVTADYRVVRKPLTGGDVETLAVGDGYDLRPELVVDDHHAWFVVLLQGVFRIAH